LVYGEVKNSGRQNLLKNVKVKRKRRNEPTPMIQLLFNVADAVYILLKIGFEPRILGDVSRTFPLFSYEFKSLPAWKSGLATKPQVESILLSQDSAIRA
jgi:hypothetical protein